MRILTLNMWNINEPLDVRMEVLRKYLIKEKPDCICFQEISKIDNRIQVEALLNELQYEYTYCLSGIWKGREEGLVIATSVPHKLIINEQLPVIQNDMRRIVMAVEIEHPVLGLLYIFNTHLAYHILNGDGRIRQMNKIFEYMKEYVNRGITVLCGDLNEDPDQGKLYKFIESYKEIRLKDTCNKNLITFSSKNKYVSKDLWPDRKIDYILYCGKIDLKSKIAMVEDDEYGCCSDHYGLLAEDI